MVANPNGPDVRDAGIVSGVNAVYVTADGNHIDYDGGLRMYAPKNENLRPVVDELMTQADGNGNGNGNGFRIFPDLAGEDVPTEVLGHSHKFHGDDNVRVYGVTGADFVLNTLYDEDFASSGRIEEGFRDFFLFEESDDGTIYEDPMVVFRALNDVRAQQRKLGIVSRSGDVFYVEPLNVGKLPQFALMGPMTDDIMGVYDDIAGRASGYSKENADSYVQRVAEKLRGMEKEDVELFYSKEFNRSDALKVRYAGRLAADQNPDHAKKLLVTSIRPYMSLPPETAIDGFTEKRFLNLAQASAQALLKDYGIIISNWEPRTRSIEGSILRHYTDHQNSNGNGARDRALLFEIWESGTSATVRNLERYAKVGDVPAVRIHVHHSEQKDEKTFLDFDTIQSDTVQLPDKKSGAAKV